MWVRVRALCHLSPDARIGRATAAQELASVTGLPEPENLSAPSPALGESIPEAGLLEKALAQRQELAADRQRLDEANLARGSAWAAYLPSLHGTAAQRWSNAPGFTGQANYWSAGLVAEWELLDFGMRSAELKRQHAAQLSSSADLRQRELDIRTEVRTAWLELEGARAKLIAARRGEEVAKRAATDVRARYKAGTASQLDVIQTDRDRLQAEADRIRAEGDLSIARIALRHATGESVVRVEPLGQR